jgi:BirA family transcriptional regulator, biotin operon repressor / biotin---[acetyl-CoA-carboxylase] ligase
MPKFVINYYDTLDSTNNEAWRLIDQGIAQLGRVVIAKIQTAGRGQRERIWRSPVGGLYMSVIFRPNISASLGTEITICTVWAIAEALRTVVPSLKIKWLNDLVVENHKVGGILTETRIASGIISYAVVGVGINWLNEVPEVGVALGDLTSNIESLEALESLVLAGIDSGWEQWQKFGIKAILPKYLEMLSTYLVKVGDRTGTIREITSSGDLVVEWHDGLGTSSVAAGSISLGYS